MVDTALIGGYFRPFLDAAAGGPIGIAMSDSGANGRGGYAANVAGVPSPMWEMQAVTGFRSGELNGCAACSVQRLTRTTQDDFCMHRAWPCLALLQIRPSRRKLAIGYAWLVAPPRARGWSRCLSTAGLAPSAARHSMHAAPTLCAASSALGSPTSFPPTPTELAISTWLPASALATKRPRCWSAGAPRCSMAPAPLLLSAQAGEQQWPAALPMVSAKTECWRGQTLPNLYLTSHWIYGFEPDRSLRVCCPVAECGNRCSDTFPGRRLAPEGAPYYPAPCVSSTPAKNMPKVWCKAPSLAVPASLPACVTSQPVHQLHCHALCLPSSDFGHNPVLCFEDAPSAPFARSAIPSSIPAFVAFLAVMTATATFKLSSKVPSTGCWTTPAVMRLGQSWL